MNYNKRIGDEYLTATYKDGQVYQHTDVNQLDLIVKTAINANYEDIQKIQDGTHIVGNAANAEYATNATNANNAEYATNATNAENSAKLSGSQLSKSTDSVLEDSDEKIPSSKQVKDYVDIMVPELVNEKTLIAFSSYPEDNPVILLTLENGGYVIKRGCYYKWIAEADANLANYDMIITMMSLNANGEICDLVDAKLRILTTINPGGIQDHTYDIEANTMSSQSYIRTDMSIIPNYKGQGSGVTQVLKNIDGVPTWVDEQ